MFSVQYCVLCSSETIVLQGGAEEKREEISGVFRGRKLSSCPGKLSVWGRCAPGSPAVGGYLPIEQRIRNLSSSSFFSLAHIILEVRYPSFEASLCY